MKVNVMKDAKWKGYTLEQLRQREVNVAVETLLERERLGHRIGLLKESFHHHGHSTKTVAGRLVSAMTVLDWIVLGVTIGRRVLPLFRKRRKR